MFVRPQHHESEKIKWIVISALAAVIALGLATVVGAADTRKPPLKPSLLPADIRDWTRPMTEVGVDEPVQADLGVEVWRVLGLQQERRFPEAIFAWHELTLSADEN